MSENVTNLSVDILKVHPRNEEFFDNLSGDKFELFKKSIKEDGVITPIIVAPDMTIISGHQRVKACKELGIKLIPAIIREELLDDDEKMKKLLASNFGRMKNNPMKQSKVLSEYEKLCGVYHGNHQKEKPQNAVSQEDIAKQLGISVDTIQRLKKLQKLAPEAQELVETGQLSYTNAVKFYTKLSQEDQKKLIDEIGKDHINELTGKQTQDIMTKLNLAQNKLKAVQEEHNNSMVTFTDKLNKVSKENEELKRKLNNQDNKDLKVNNEAAEENKKLNSKVTELGDKLVAMQNEEQKERDRIREEEKKKIEEDKKDEISDLKIKIDKLTVDLENAKADKEEKSRQLKAVSGKVHEEIDKGVLEKSAAFDYTPEILKECDKIDETLGGSMQKLDSIYQTIGEFDDRSQQRLYYIIQTLQNSVEKISVFLGQRSEDTSNISGMLNLTGGGNDSQETGLNLK